MFDRPNSETRPQQRSTHCWTQLAKRTASCSLFVLAFLLGGCSKPEPETYYEPPTKPAPDGVEEDWISAACGEYQAALALAKSGRHAELAAAIQQLLLQLGVDEIRADPLVAAVGTTDTEPNGEHLTASIRGVTRDTLLIISTSPTEGDSALLAQLAVARAWSQSTGPEQAPLMTLRFAVLASADEISAALAAQDFLSHRPRTVTQTAAVIVLDAAGAPGWSTSEPRLEPIARELNQNAETAMPADSALSKALEEAGLSSISGGFPDLAGPPQCSPRGLEPVRTAAQQVLTAIETAMRHLGKPPAGEISLSEG